MSHHSEIDKWWCSDCKFVTWMRSVNQQFMSIVLACFFLWLASALPRHKNVHTRNVFYKKKMTINVCKDHARTTRFNFRPDAREQTVKKNSTFRKNQRRTQPCRLFPDCVDHVRFRAWHHRDHAASEHGTLVNNGSIMWAPRVQSRCDADFCEAHATPRHIVSLAINRDYYVSRPNVTHTYTHSSHTSDHSPYKYHSDCA